MRSSLLQWCYSGYGENNGTRRETYFVSRSNKMRLQIFSSWMHFCAVRVFTESILRYGLPPSFLACVLAPSQKSEKKVCSILERLCGSANRTNWKSEDEVGAMVGLAGDADTHPYVFIHNQPCLVGQCYCDIFLIWDESIHQCRVPVDQHICL